MRNYHRSVRFGTRIATVGGIGGPYLVADRCTTTGDAARAAATFRPLDLGRVWQVLACLPVLAPPRSPCPRSARPRSAPSAGLPLVGVAAACHDSELLAQSVGRWLTTSLEVEIF